MIIAPLLRVPLLLKMLLDPTLGLALVVGVAL
jgi:hypothetical protein